MRYCIHIFTSFVNITLAETCSPTPLPNSRYCHYVSKHNKRRVLTVRILQDSLKALDLHSPSSSPLCLSVGAVNFLHQLGFFSHFCISWLFDFCLRFGLFWLKSVESELREISRKGNNPRFRSILNLDIDLLDAEDRSIREVFFFYRCVIVLSRLRNKLGNDVSCEEKIKF